MKKKILAAVSLFTVLGLLGAGCKRPVPPVLRQAAAEHQRALDGAGKKCAACVQRSCAAEMAACAADTTLTAGDPRLAKLSRCGCFALCSLPLAACIAACGQPDALYDALARCQDANCTDACPRDTET